MNRYLTFSLVISMTLSSLAIPLRAANKPRARKTEKTIWTNEDLEKLRRLAAISIAGQPNKADDSTTAAMLLPYLEAQDPHWYAGEAVARREALGRRPAKLSEFRHALE